MVIRLSLLLSEQYSLGLLLACRPQADPITDRAAVAIDRP